MVNNISESTTSTTGVEIKCDIIITELAIHGNLCDCLEKIKICSEDVARTIVKQLV